MTEEEWLTFTHPGDVLQSLYVRAGQAARKNPAYPEKLRRFAIACCRRMGRMLAPDELRALDLLDRYCDARDHDDLKAARKAIRAGYDASGPWDEHDERDARSSMTGWARQHAKHALGEVHRGKPSQAAGNVYWVAAKVVAALHALDTGKFPPLPINNTPDPQPEELATQSAIIRDIFGNPFRPVTFNPAWRTDTAVSLAKQMYESQDFSAMPILADALQDAGCDSEEVLKHCRDAKQVHVRGCWVVDLVLGKE